MPSIICQLYWLSVVCTLGGWHGAATVECFSDIRVHIQDWLAMRSGHVHADAGQDLDTGIDKFNKYRPAHNYHVFNSTISSKGSITLPQNIQERLNASMTDDHSVCAVM